MFCNVNVWAIIVATLAAMAIGFVWYAPWFLGTRWMALVGFTQEDIQRMSASRMAKRYVAHVIGLLITFFILARVMFMIGSSTAWQGASVAFWAWVGFIAPIMFGGVIWEKRPRLLYVINVVGWLIPLVVGGFIIGAWR